MRLDPNTVRQQITTLLLKYPELQEDDILRADMIEGETETYDLLSQIVRKIGDAQALAEGTKQYIQQLTERKARIERREESLRLLAFNIMQSGEIKKAELPEGTLSIRNGTPKVIITDEKALPDAFLNFVATPSKTTIKEAIGRGESVPGACLSNAEPCLMLKVK